MAYTTRELEALSLKAIEENKIVFLDELAAYLPVSRATIYNHGLDKLDTIKESIANNRILGKAGMRRTWEHGDNATTQIAWYKLVSTKEEHAKLTGSSTDITTLGDKITLPSKMTNEERAARIVELRGEIVSE